MVCCPPFDCIILIVSDTTAIEGEISALLFVNGITFFIRVNFFFFLHGNSNRTKEHKNLLDRAMYQLENTILPHTHYYSLCIVASDEQKPICRAGKNLH